jgi:glutathione S-transferase
MATKSAAHDGENSMKLYMHPASATCRAITLFAAESGIALDEQLVDLMAGEHRGPDYLAINRNGLVPVLRDGDFTLSESSAILKYLADKAGSAAYPKDLRERARVNEAMDWFNANLYRDFGYNLIYPQIFPHHRRRSGEANDATVRWGQEKTRDWLGILDKRMIGPRSDYVCLDRLTIADYFGSGLVTLGDVIQFDLSRYPNVERWIGRMKRLPSWPRVNEGFYGMVEACKGQQYVAA